MTTDDTLLKQFIFDSGQVWDELTGRHFYPLRDTRYFDHPRQNPTRLKFDEDLLEIETFYTQNGNVLVSSSNYFLMCGKTYNRTPYNMLTMRRDGDQSYLLYSGTLQRSNIITGLWGFHDNYSKAWTSVDTLTGDLAASLVANTVGVNSVTALGPYGILQRFQTLQLVKIGAEQMLVTAWDSDATSLTVTRAYNNTELAAHTSGATIEVYNAPGDIVRWITRMVDYFYGQKDTKSQGYSNRPIIMQSGAVVLPEGFPQDIAEAATHYTYRSGYDREVATYFS